jgi:hypothetical protein
MAGSRTAQSKMAVDLDLESNGCSGSVDNSKDQLQEYCAPQGGPMKQPLSYTRFENELLPRFRKQISEAESTEEMKNFFSYSIQELFRLVFSGQIEVRDTDVRLSPEKQPPFELSEEISSNEIFMSVWNTSDLSNIITRFSEAAMHHYLRLVKNMQKTEGKIRAQGM